MTLQIGVLLVVLTVLYIVPRAALLGALLLTGYLGGALASQMRIGAPAFCVAFPVIIAVTLWGVSGCGILPCDMHSFCG